MRKRKNTSPPIGPDACPCGTLAQTTLSATGDTLRALGFPEDSVERVSLRVCLGCYLRAMAEATARGGPKSNLPPAPTKV